MHARIGWQNLRTSEFLDSGNYMLITGTDFNDGAINFSTCHYVERERYEQDRNIQIHNGSILITKDGTLGKVAYVQGLSMPATLNAGVFNVQIKDANNVDEKYLFQYLKAPFLMDYVDKKATGGTIKHLNQSILVDFPVILPQRSEQTLIGAFFQQLDNLITLHQRKYEKLKSMKAALLEKIFPSENETTPKIRFKGFTEAWEQRKNEDIGICFSGGMLSYASLSDTGQYKCVLYGDLYTQYDTTIFKIDRRTNQKGNTIYKNDILFPQSTTVDAYSLISPACLNEKIAETSGVFVIRPSKNIDGNFVAYYSKGNEKQRNKLAKKAQGLTIVHLYYQSIKNETILIPSLIEQKKISSLLIKLDNLITLHQRKQYIKLTKP